MLIVKICLISITESLVFVIRHLSTVAPLHMIQGWGCFIFHVISDPCAPVMWNRIHLGPWIRIQRYKMKGFSALKVLKSDLRNKLKEDIFFAYERFFEINFVYCPGSGSRLNFMDPDSHY